jgi:probable HAF family extracellular repeat protein
MTLARIVGSLVLTLAIGNALSAQDTAPANSPKDRRYKFVDLGTFGGPLSGIQFFARGVINSAGSVTGGADTSIPDPYFPNCFSPNCVVQHAFKWKDGVLNDLGALPGTNSSYGFWMNERGWVVGPSQNGVIDPLTSVPEWNAVLWKGSKIINLGTLGGNQSAGIGVNNAGQVTGWALNPIPDSWGLACPCGTQSRAFLWQNGVMRDLGTLGGPDSFGQYVNDGGHVAGFSFTNNIPNPTTGIPTVDPFFWDGRKMRDLGTLGGTFGAVNDMNNKDQVIGTSNLDGDIEGHAFMWDPAQPTMRDLGTLGGTFAIPSMLNKAGTVVGVATNTNDELLHAVLWRDFVIHDLGTVPGDGCSWAWGVNARDQVVGISLPFPCDFSVAHAFLWDRGSMVDLNTLIPSNSSFKLVYSVAIDDAGEIIGIGVPGGVSPRDVEVLGHAYLLIPEEDSSDSPKENIEPKSVSAANVAEPANARVATAEMMRRIRDQQARKYHRSRK